MKKSSIIRTIAIIAGIYIIGQGICREFFSQRIKNLDDLQRILKEEAMNIGRIKESKDIYCFFGKSPWGTAASGKIRKGQYLLILDKDRSRTAVRHELYHIFRGHCDKAYEVGEWTTFDKIKNEITARLYADYGLRL